MKHPHDAFMNDVNPTLDGTVPPENRENKLVRIVKNIAFNPERGTYIDESLVKFKYYNSFNYSLLSTKNEDVRLTVGITSANVGEGKTLVASNLAVSLAMGSQKKTVLVDLNIKSPRLHEIFGTVSSPGLAEAFTNGTIHVSHTAIKHLSVLSLGHLGQPVAPDAGEPVNIVPTISQNGQTTLGLDRLTAFRDIMYSLEQEFEFVIVDMPALSTETVPVLFANQLNGLIVVVNSGRTKREDLDALFQQINERQVIGFVFNRFNAEPH